jgi:hypothetical protein
MIMLMKLLLWFACQLAEIADVESQDAIADSLIADEPETPAGDETGEEAVDEQPLEAGEEDQLEEDDADWLPTEQERIFPDAAIERYAKGRYPELLNAFKNPSTPDALRQQVRQILHDKLNGDIQIQRQLEAPLEEEEEAAPVAQQVTQKLPTREEYFNGIRTQIRSRQDPQVAKEFFQGFNKVYGLSDEQQAELLKANPNAAVEFTELFTMYGLNMINTFADQLIWSHLAPQLEQMFPGFQDMHASSSNIRSWDKVRNSTEAYQKLPAYGTKEFSTKARTAATTYFGSDDDFENAQFSKVVNGQRVPLTPSENAQKKYGILAKIMSGQMVDPRLIQQAVKTGAKGARRQQLTRSAGSSRPGVTRAQAGPRNGKDDLFDEGLKLYRQEHGAL